MSSVASTESRNLAINRVIANLKQLNRITKAVKSEQITIEMVRCLLIK